MTETPHEGSIEARLDAASKNEAVLLQGKDTGCVLVERALMREAADALADRDKEIARLREQLREGWAWVEAQKRAAYDMVKEQTDRTEAAERALSEAQQEIARLNETTSMVAAANDALVREKQHITNGAIAFERERDDLRAALATVRKHICGDDPDHDNWQDYQDLIDEALRARSALGEQE